MLTSTRNSGSQRNIVNMDNRRRDEPDDYPPYSRLFIVCDKRSTEEDIRNAFAEFGEVEDVQVPKNHNTGEPKGVAFVKFNKTSEAAVALEKMHQRSVPGFSRPLKVMVATNRSSIHTDDDPEKYKRLFINTFKTTSEKELEDHFKQFGPIEDIQIQRDRNTGESKGFAYIKYRKFSHAAIALESCDRQYRPVFAQPKFRHRPETTFESNIDNLASSASNMRTSLISMMNPRVEGYTRVNYLCAPFLNHHQVESLFNLIPGLAACQHFVDLARNCGKGTVSYSSPICAAYAVEKLHNFEYPPGCKVFVQPNTFQFNPYEQQGFTKLPVAVNKLHNAMRQATSGETDLAKLAEAIAEASKLIKAATAGITDEVIPDSQDLNYCSVKLPSPQPLADIDAPVAKRCFLVCKPQPPPLTVLRDVFCRFGNLINVYTLPNKTVGYARYAKEESANAAISKLHGAEICGVRIKVLEAEAEAPPKRRRYE